jgi:hypothetical protein
MVFTRVAELPLDEVKDPRRDRGKRWLLRDLLAAMVVGMAAGCRGFGDVEALTAEMGWPARRRLGLSRRVPDTTLHDMACRLDPNELRPMLHAQVKAAHRRKALEPQELPFHVASLDGKFVNSTEANDAYAQGHPAVDGHPAFGSVRTITATLSTSSARVCLDAIPIPARTNEMGHFKVALDSLVKVYGKLFKVITYDAGACSKENALATLANGLDYLFSLKGGAQTRLHNAALCAFELKRDPLAETRDVISKGRVVVRRLWLWRKGDVSDFPGLQTVALVQSRVEDRQGSVLLNDKGEPQIEERYFVSSMERERLTPKQWLKLVRCHWRVETCHQTLDVAFEEDERPWIRSNPKAMVVIQLLRRIAYNMLALYRSVSQRSEAKRAEPWKSVMRSVVNALIAVTEEQLFGLRFRAPVTVFG